jgi:hypothetical protein
VESSSIDQALAGLRDCYIYSFVAYSRKHHPELAPQEAELKASRLLDSAFAKYLKDQAHVTRMSLEALANKLNAELGITNDPEILEDLNGTLFLYISDLQDSITVI